MNIIEAHETTKGNVTTIVAIRAVVDTEVKIIYTIDHSTGIVSHKEGKFRTSAAKGMQGEYKEEIEEIRNYIKN